MVHIGNEIIVLDLDRLGRNNHDITKVLDTIRSKQATFRALSLPSFDGIEDPNLRALLNNLIIEIYKYQAEHERAEIRYRQQQGIEIAKKKVDIKASLRSMVLTLKIPGGRYIYNEVVRKLSEGMGITEISKQLGLNRMTIYRIKSTL